MSRAIKTQQQAKVVQVTPDMFMRGVGPMMKAGYPVIVSGPPGIGKTQMIIALCVILGYDIVIWHPAVDDPTDYKGFPAIIDGEAVFVPFSQLNKIMQADKPLVCFFDDIGQAPPSVQKALMQVILAREINGKKISDHVRFIAATNRKEDRAGVSGILETVKSRFHTIIELIPDLDYWCKWALDAGQPIELVAFLKFRPELFNDFKPTADLTNSPIPRTIANLGDIFNLHLDPDLELPFYAGAVGEGFAVEFLGFLKIFRTLPNPDAVVMDPDNAQIPNDSATLWALCGALAKKMTLNTVDALFKYFNRLEQEFQVLAVTMAVRECADIQQTRPYTEWSIRNQDAFA